MAYGNFKHALIQGRPTVRCSSPRCDIHRRIAETLTACFPVITEMQPGSWHSTIARRNSLRRQRIVGYVRGERAIAQGTPRKRTFFNHALARSRRMIVVNGGWRGLQGRQTVFDLLEDRGTAWFEALLALARTCNDDVRLAEAFLTYADYAYRVEDYQRMLDASEAAIAATTCSGDRLLEAQDCRRSGRIGSPRALGDGAPNRQINTRYPARDHR